MRKHSSEKPVTVKQASEITGIQEWKLRNCIKNKILKAHTLFNSRQLIFVSDIFELIEASMGVPQTKRSDQ